jgi:preprotein translocase subunit SecG
MLNVTLTVFHVLACAILVFVVLLQQGRGGGMGAAFGGASSQVFGGSGAGNILTRATGIAAGVFLVTSLSLAFMSSSGDRAMKARIAMEQQKKAERGTKRKEKKEEHAPAPGPSADPTPAPSGSN